MTTELVQLRIDGGIAALHLNRPDKRNAMNDELRAQFVAALERVAADREIRALVLTGNGKGFCAGGDVEAMAKRLETPPGDVAFIGWTRQQGVHRAQTLLRDLPIPTIAAVNGAAAGLGADTALACDFVLASTDASFAWSYINRGLIADGGGMYLLPRRVGLAKAKELIFTGRRIDAQEAMALGVADRLAAPDALLNDAHVWARELGKGSRTALALGKTILNNSFEQTADETFAQGSLAQSACYTSSEHRESVIAFVQKAGSGKEELK
jgi:enoyl-CoA hydratase/carnithine racemase